MPEPTRLLLALCAAGCAFFVAAQDPVKPQLTARELFYSAASEPAPKKADAKTEPKSPPRKAPPVVSAHRTPPPAPPPASGAGTSAPATGTSTAAAAATTPPKPGAADLPGGGKVVMVASTTAPAPETGTPLGLKYTILKGDAQLPVPSDTVFHTGDGIQLSVETNGPGYLYIVSQGSSGTWKPMFPSPEVADGNNHVDSWHAYTLPPKSRMVFDEQTGVEKIFVVFSREPETDLENMIYSLKGEKPQTPKPVNKPQDQPKQLVQIARVNIDDATVDRLRETYSRDLIIEPVNDKTPADHSAADKSETAVYVVNATGSAGSRVVADLRLVHQ